ncbi:hypothetical protein WDU94_004061 [Cyamophila willieti]
MFTNRFWKDTHDERIKAEARLFARIQEKEEDHNPRMTKTSLRKVCKDTKLYLTPALNDVLYLHFKGYTVIENLEDYTGLKCIWLENNGISKIENLDAQTEMRSLYMHHNLVRVLENLDHMQMLDTINLSHNLIGKIENLSCLPNLRTLHISHNKLCTLADIEHLKECPKLSIVDVSHNHLEDEEVIHVFGGMQQLRVLTLSRNPCVSKIKNYRRMFINLCKNLKHLDDYPVFDKDRKCAEAWLVGGIEAERDMRDKLNQEEHDKLRASVMALMSLNRHRHEAEEQNERNIEREQRRTLGLQDSTDSEGGSSTSTTSDPTPPEDIQDDVENIENKNENDSRSSEEEDPDYKAAKEKDKNTFSKEFEEKFVTPDETRDEKSEHKTAVETPDDLPNIMKSINQEEIIETKDNEDDNLNAGNSEIPITTTEYRIENISGTNDESEQKNSLHLIAPEIFYEIDLNKSRENYDIGKEDEQVEIQNEEESCMIEEYGSNIMDIVSIDTQEEDKVITIEDDIIPNMTIDVCCNLTQNVDPMSMIPSNIACKEIIESKDKNGDSWENKWSLLDDEVNQTHIFDIYQEKSEFSTNNLLSEIENNSNQKVTESVRNGSNFKIPKIIIEELNENECSNLNDTYFVDESPHEENKNWLEVKPSNEIVTASEHGISNTQIDRYCDAKEKVSLTKDGQEIEHVKTGVFQEADEYFEKNVSEAYIEKEIECSLQANYPEKEDIEIITVDSVPQETIENDCDSVPGEKPDPNENVEITKKNIEKLEDFLFHTDYEPGDLMALRKQRKESKFIEKNVAELRKDIKDMEQSMLQDKMSYDLNIKELKGSLIPILNDTTIMASDDNNIMKVLNVNERSKERTTKSYLSLRYDNLIKAHTECELTENGSTLPEMKPSIPEKSETFVEFFENTRGSLSKNFITFPEILDSIEEYNDKQDSIVIDFDHTMEKSSDDNVVVIGEEEKVSLTTTLEFQMADTEDED